MPVMPPACCLQPDGTGGGDLPIPAAGDTPYVPAVMLPDDHPFIAKQSTATVAQQHTLYVGGEAIQVFDFDADSGALSPVAATMTDGGQSNGSFMAFSADWKFLYTIMSPPSRGG
jgi:hypothetical protein